ncbi:hypothetical protein KKG22_01820 [Patescibacteria group bacterium]|nr:hypothetical protein [Patescibacteria group bacterium]MBU1721906.1 hypothetical protein [Patescibacteria group bacterium]MBU1900862.1 hypothetical protein [Patescibacteria group bacterium]
MKKIFGDLMLGEGKTVVLEGPPIYLAHSIEREHRDGYALLHQMMTYLRRLGCFVEHHMLLDEVHGEERPGLREEYIHLAGPVDRIVCESEFIGPAKEWLTTIPKKMLQTGGNGSPFRKLGKEPYPLLVRHNGTPACPLLDASFQLSKKINGQVPDLLIIIHPKVLNVGDQPVSFEIQQAGMLEVLKALRHDGNRKSWLPWKLGVMNIWLGYTGEIVGLTRTFMKKGDPFQFTLRRKPTSDGLV